MREATTRRWLQLGRRRLRRGAVDVVDRHGRCSVVADQSSRRRRQAMLRLDFRTGRRCGDRRVEVEFVAAVAFAR